MNTTGRTTSAHIRSLPNPHALATRLAAPSRTDRIEDPVVQGLQWARTAVGLVATVWLVMAYPITEGREQFVMGKLEDLLFACAIMFSTAFLAVTAFICAARSPLTGVYARRLTGPLLTIGAILASFGACWFMVACLKGDIISTADFGYHGILVGLLVMLLFILGGLACFLGLLLAVPLTLLLIVYGVNSSFRVGDVHELLPPLLSPLLVWSLFALSMFDDPDVAAPPLVLYSFLLGGPLSVTALSVWEIRRLKRRHGVTVRSALGRAASPHPVHRPQPPYPPYAA
ncbi:hypothetical protein JCM4814A_69930 [Streptomyces phaeofaciens JCM 4814]|uniref:Uncharacterized protein n=1 Tax=Streptomyces phaeofaciens TaxID=68254 RepID=A0A918LRJ1_9ACTN|nr:hypothetical protein [Streptomyces phaeofaciens]GGT42228.1 hypothetical protein GCM10010226_18570 [Streptomyces phaeofaciens]